MSRADLIHSSVAAYLANFRIFYPGISEWYFRLVEGFASGRRRMFVSWDGPSVDGLAITKNGHRAKLCHISVSPAARDCGLGSTLAHSALCDMVRHGAREIRVTTSEEVFRGHKLFFRAIGFRPIDHQVNRYRRNVSEILWKLDVDPVRWRHCKRCSVVPQHSIEVFGASSTPVRPPLPVVQTLLSESLHDFDRLAWASLHRSHLGWESFYKETNGMAQSSPLFKKSLKYPMSLVADDGEPHASFTHSKVVCPTELTVLVPLRCVPLHPPS